MPHWGKNIARRIASCTWDVKRNGHTDPADLIVGKTPNRAFWNAQTHATRANTNHLWECAISALVFLCTGGVSSNLISPVRLVLEDSSIRSFCYLLMFLCNLGLYSNLINQHKIWNVFVWLHGWVTHVRFYGRLRNKKLLRAINTSFLCFLALYEGNAELPCHKNLRGL